jgi:glyoxylase-like metal-dependent hydrolase (beta-lactamase superfamily II)
MQIETLPLGEYQANCYVIRSERLAMVIDPGEASPAIINAVGNRTVSFVINTHCHPDHIGGNSFICEHYQAPLYFHKEDEQIFQFFLGTELKPDRYLQEGDELLFDDLKFRILHTPGHSPGSVTLLFESERVLFTGDLLFAGSICRTDFPGGDLTQMKRSLQRVVDLPGEYQIYSGHGPNTTLDRERKFNSFVLELTE